MDREIESSIDTRLKEDKYSRHTHWERFTQDQIATMGMSLNYIKNQMLQTQDLQIKDLIA
jgi:hypothetical protein